MKWINVLDLDRWADTTASRTSLSELVSALVRASAPERTSFLFPTGDSAQAPGYDGSLEAKGLLPFVPDGKSVWEFGVERRYLHKANEEYGKRTKTPRGANQSETTFVFVSPRHWKRGKPSLEEWQNVKTREGVWKSVRAIDGAGLERWLEECPAVAARLAREVLEVMPASGARSTEEYWEEFSSRFDPTLCEDALLCGRERQADIVRQQLIGAADAYSWQADSPEEVVAFTVAAIRRADSDLRRFLEARTLIVDTEEAARQLSRRRNTIFLPRANALQQIGMLANHAPTVVPLGRKDPTPDAMTTLERPTSYEMGKAFESMGFTSDDSVLWARKCGCSVTILVRLRPSGTETRPEWDGKMELVPALVAGAWDASSDGDRAVVQMLAGTSTYAEYEDKLLAYLHMDDPVIERVGTVWKMRAPVLGFLYLGSIIGTQHFGGPRTGFGAGLQGNRPRPRCRRSRPPLCFFERSDLQTQRVAPRRTGNNTAALCSLRRAGKIIHQGRGPGLCRPAHQGTARTERKPQVAGQPPASAAAPDGGRAPPFAVGPRATARG